MKLVLDIEETAKTGYTVYYVYSDGKEYTLSILPPTTAILKERYLGCVNIEHGIFVEVQG